jgi:hypothetical protein
LNSCMTRSTVSFCGSDSRGAICQSPLVAGPTPKNSGPKKRFQAGAGKFSKASAIADARIA